MSGTARRVREILGVLGGALLVVALLLHFQGPDTPLRGDQQWGNLMALKHLHPDWLAGDVFYGPPYYRGYNPAFFSLQARVARAAGGDVEDALRLLAWPIGLLFLVGHYALFRHLTGSWPAAALGALSALVVRNALGGEYWGFSGLRDVLPRAIASGLTPLLVLAFLRLRGHPLFAGYFLLVGLAANLHPVSGLHLAQISAVAHLWLSRFQARAWRDVLLGVPLFAIGALPFILRYVPAQEHLSDPALLPVVREALHYRYPYLLFPLDPSSVISVAFHAGLPIAVLLWVLRRGQTPEALRVLLTMAVAALVVGVGGIALIQTLGVLSGKPYVDIHQLRATRFMYPALLAAFPLAYAALLRARRPRAWLLLAALLLLSAIPPGSVIHAVSAERRDAAKRALGIQVSAPRPAPAAPPGAEEESRRAERRLWSFAAQHTEPAALVFTDSFAFRYETLRPITGSFKDGGIVIAGTGPLYRWYVYMREVEDCRRRRGEACWFALAEKYHGRYAVVDPELDRAAPADGRWTRIWSEAGWSFWRRGPSA
ncbi:MAG TPA: hypothetical protein VK878_24725 [Candidatus Deferrimicrobiaceae bacterium]|nr:hypothetical protein [Candidatus Deferrimicrobiaceae bacterium]